MLLEGREIPARPQSAGPWMKKAAEAGNKSALMKLAKMYIDGTGVPQDLAMGVSYCENGAKAGLPPGMACMGYVYRSGRGRSANIKTSIDWYKKAAGCGEANSTYALGQMYKTGEGVLQDPVEAYALLTIAGGALPKAKEEAEALRPTLTAAQLKKAQKEMIEFPAKNRPRLCLWE
jgi:hypothetical protein